MLMKIKHYYNLFIGKKDEVINNYAEALIVGFGIGSPFFIFTEMIIIGIVIISL